MCAVVAAPGEGHQTVARSGGRRQQASHEDRQQRLIFMGAGGVLALVLVIVVIGLITAWYLPPRAHVLTVGDREFTARDVADRGIYLARAGNPLAQQNPASEGLESLLREQVLLQAGPAVVGEATDDDVYASLAETFELGEDYTNELVDAQLEGSLEVTVLSRAQLFDLIRAGVIEERLIEQFEAELPETGDQMHLMAVRTGSPAEAQELVDAVRGGADFTETAVEMELVTAEEGPALVGWYAPNTLPERLAALADLPAGGIADPIEDASRVGYEVFFVSERTDDEPYTEAVRNQLAALALSDWMDEHEATLTVERSLGSSDEDWIRRQVAGASNG